MLIVVEVVGGRSGVTVVPVSELDDSAVEVDGSEVEVEGSGLVFDIESGMDGGRGGVNGESELDDSEVEVDGVNCIKS